MHRGEKMTSGGICYKSGCERGAWFELKCIRETIAAKEAAGQDASFERSLYRAWLKDPDFKKADEDNQRKGFYGRSANVRNRREAVPAARQRESIASRRKRTAGKQRTLIKATSANKRQVT